MEDQFHTVAFSSPELYHRIFDACTPQTMFRLGRVSTHTHLALKNFINLSFDINAHFARFFSDPIRFRRLQAATHFVVSGSNALQFLNRNIYPESDLDLYVNFQKVLDVCQFILDDSVRAYTFVTHDEKDRDFVTFWEDFIARATRHQIIHEGVTAYRLKDILDVLTFISRDEGGHIISRVQVIVTDLDPLVCILAFHSSEFFFLRKNQEYSFMTSSSQLLS